MRISLLTASKYCLALWAAIWVIFMAIRFSPLDIRVVPGAGPIMLALLIAALLAPIGAIGLSIAAVARQPRAGPGWIMLGLAMAALFGQACLFMVTRWM